MGNVKIKRILASAAAAWAACVLAADWTGTAGNFQLDDASNWDSAPQATSWCYVRNRTAQPLTVGGDGDFFGGAMLRYTAGGGSYTITNDFGAGMALTNLGLKAESALHIESGAKLVQVSGGLRCFKGTKYDGTYVTDNSSLTLDGPDTWFEQIGSTINLRSNNSSSNPVCPKFFVTNGASLKVTGTLNVGCANKNASAYASLAGAGTRAEVNFINVGAQTPFPEKAITNILVVADCATVTGNTVVVGRNSPFARLEVAGANMTVKDRLSMGNIVAASSNCWLHVLSGGSLTSLGTTVIGRVEEGNGALVCVSDIGSSFTALGQTGITGGVFRVEDGGKTRVQSALTLCGARVESRGAGASFTVTGDTGARGASNVFSATGGASNNVKRLNVQNVVVEGALSYERIYMDTTGGELVFTNATVTGTRIEMTQSSTIRLVNTHLSVTNGIFMMGDLSGSNAENNAYKRDVYVGGTDTWVRVTQDNGFYIRGSNTTIYVEIPAEGFSTSHPVFDIPKVHSEGNRHIRVEVTADPQLLGRGGTYTLFRTSADNSCQSTAIDWIYDPAFIAIDKSVTKEVRVRVKHLGGIIIFR